MKKVTFIIGIILISLLSLTSCETIEYREGPVVKEYIILRDTVIEQTDKGQISFIKKIGDTLKHRTRVHLGTLKITDYIGYRLRDIDVQLSNSSFNASTFLEEEGLVVIPSNDQLSFYNYQRSSSTSSYMSSTVIITDPETIFEIYAELKNFPQNTFFNFDIEVSLSKDSDNQTGETEEYIDFEYDSNKYTVDGLSIPVLGTAGDTPVRLLVGDIDIDKRSLPNQQVEAEVEIELDNSTDFTVLLNEPGIIFVVEGVEYTTETLSDNTDFTVSFDFDDYDAERNIVIYSNRSEEYTMTIVGPVGKSITIKGIPLKTGSTETNITFDILIQL